jgi:hypothetical protein
LYRLTGQVKAVVSSPHAREVRSAALAVLRWRRSQRGSGRNRLAQAADEGSSISVDGSSGSAMLKGLDGIRLGMVPADSKWLIDSGYALDDTS